MDATFINTENSKTNEPHRFRLYFKDKLDLRSRKTISLANLSKCYTWENIKSSYNNNKFKISGPTWSETFDLPDGSYEIQDIQTPENGNVVWKNAQIIVPLKYISFFFRSLELPLINTKLYIQLITLNILEYLILWEHQHLK